LMAAPNMTNIQPAIFPLRHPREGNISSLTSCIH
jgi:hypothetical protein